MWRAKCGKRTRLDGAGNVVGGVLDAVAGLLSGGLLAVGLQGRGGLVGGGLAAEEEVC